MYDEPVVWNNSAEEVLCATTPERQAVKFSLKSETADKLAADATTGRSYDVPCLLGVDSTKRISKS